MTIDLKKLEIVAFYPLTRDDEKEELTGSLHVRFADLGIELRGVYVSKRKSYIHFKLPNQKVQTAEGTWVAFPSFSFTDRDETRRFIDHVIELGIPYVEAYLKENPQASTQQKAAEPIKEIEPSKEVPAPPKSAPKQKVWVTPPPIKNRKKTAAKR